MTPLSYIITMEKALDKIVFGRKMFICQPIFKMFVSLFTTFGMQKDNKITFCWRCFRTILYAKRLFSNDGVVGDSEESFSRDKSHFILNIPTLLLFAHATKNTSLLGEKQIALGPRSPSFSDNKSRLTRPSGVVWWTLFELHMQT